MTSEYIVVVDRLRFQVRLNSLAEKNWKVSGEIHGRLEYLKDSNAAAHSVDSDIF